MACIETNVQKVYEMYATPLSLVLKDIFAGTLLLRILIIVLKSSVAIAETVSSKKKSKEKRHTHRHPSWQADDDLTLHLSQNGRILQQLIASQLAGSPFRLRGGVVVYFCIIL